MNKSFFFSSLTNFLYFSFLLSLYHFVLFQFLVNLSDLNEFQLTDAFLLSQLTKMTDSIISNL